MHQIMNGQDICIILVKILYLIIRGEWKIFLGRIRAMQLEYTKAYENLLTATRKAPQQTAIGFRQNVNSKIEKNRG
jgi:hypothetical protein